MVGRDGRSSEGRPQAVPREGERRPVAPDPAEGAGGEEETDQVGKAGGLTTQNDFTLGLSSGSHACSMFL